MANDAIYTVIDTNVLVSFLLASGDSPVATIFDAVRRDKLRPLYSSHLLREYRRVLLSDRFGFDKETVYLMLQFFEIHGKGVEPVDNGSSLVDSKDSPIIDIVQSTRECHSILVTGNIKHHPKVDYVVTPRELVDRLDIQRS